MKDRQPKPIREVLERAAGEGERPAGELLPLLYQELRKLAAARLLDCPGATVVPTDLVHEAYLQLSEAGDPTWSGRAHFFGAAARAMRNVLVDRARARGAAKRGGDRRREELTARIAAESAPELSVVELHEALAALESRSSRAAQVVELRYFAGLTIREAAETIGVSTATVEREWTYARAWLLNRLRTGAPEDDAR